MIDAAIVGLGRWGRILVESVQGKSERIRFTAGVTRTPAKAEAFARAAGLRPGNDLEAVLADPAIDAVVLATPHTLHAEQIVAAAKAGKHVFCEKPFTLTLADAERALAAVEAAGIALGIGYNRRFAPNTALLADAVRSAKLGTLLHIEGNFSANMAAGIGGTWRADAAESPAGVMTSLGIHLVDAFIQMFGRIRTVEAISKRLAVPFPVDDTTVALVEFADGRTGTLATLGATAHLYHIRALGTAGWAEIVQQDRFEALSVDGTRRSETFEGYEYPAVATVRAGVEAFAEAAAGGAPFPVTPEEIAHGVAVFEAIVRAAATGERQRV